MKNKLLSGIIWVFFLSGFASSYGEDIFALMKKYEEKSELSKKTKEESLGHILIFTRKDLELMQAYTLADVLKLIPLNNLLPNKYGVESLGDPGTPVNIPYIYRLYIDDHEVSSIHTYSPFLTYDRYLLDNIDHIEIYYSSGAIGVSTEPSNLIIKMYTKAPERENISKFRISTGTKKTYSLNIFSANQINESSSYLVSFDKSYFTFPKPYINGKNVNRNQFRKSVFFKYRYKNTDFEFSGIEVKRGGFVGVSVDKSPDFSHIDSLDTYMSITHKLNNNTKLTFSYDFQKRKYKEKNKTSDGGLSLIKLYNPFNPPTYYYEKFDFHKFAVAFDKKLKSKNNSLLIGTFLRYYKEDPLENYYIDSKNTRYDLINEFRVKNYKILSIYAENSFNFNKKNLLIAGANFNKYKFYGQKSKDRLNLRAGMISFLNHSIMIKGFLSRFYQIPSMFLIEASEKNKLEPMTVNSATAEVKFTFSKNELRLFTGYYRISNLISFDSNVNAVVNTGKNRNFHEYSILYKWRINRFFDLEFIYWFTDSQGEKYSPNRGGYLQLFGDFEKFRFYTGLIYKGSYGVRGLHVKKSLDLKFAASYRLPRDWYLKLVGENLLNKSEKGVYFNAFGDKGDYSVYNRELFITIEKVF